MVEDNEREPGREEESGSGVIGSLIFKPPDRATGTTTMEVETEAKLLTEGPSALKLS